MRFNQWTAQRTARWTFLAATLGALCAVGVAAQAHAADAAKFPTKPVRFVVGFAPGGAADIPARLVAQRLTEALGQQVIVDNKPGADGIVAADYVAKAPPDGYTMAYVTAGHAMNSILHAKTLPYKAVDDFAVVSIVASGPLVLVVNPALPVKNFKELVALAKARPGKMNFASAGSGGTMHLAGELLKYMAKIDIVHVPYKGGGPALTDVIGGQIEFTFVGAPAAMPHIRAGRLRLLAVSTAKRAAALPDVPTVAELGYPGFEVATWYAALAPARTPAPIVNQVSTEISKVVNTADMREKLLALGIEPVGNTPGEATAYIRSEIARWTPIMQKAGVKLE